MKFGPRLARDSQELTNKPYGKINASSKALFCFAFVSTSIQIHWYLFELRDIISMLSLLLLVFMSLRELLLSYCFVSVYNLLNKLWHVVSLIFVKEQNSLKALLWRFCIKHIFFYFCKIIYLYRTLRKICNTSTKCTNFRHNWNYAKMITIFPIRLPKQHPINLKNIERNIFYMHGQNHNVSHAVYNGRLRASWR